MVLNSTGDVQTVPTVYTFVDGDSPLFVWRQTAGTPVARLDLVPADIKVQTNLNQRDLYSVLGPGLRKPQGSVPTIGPLLEFDWLTRNDETVSSQAAALKRPSDFP